MGRDISRRLTVHRCLGYQPGNIALGDVNHDGILDLGVTSRDDSSEYVHVLLGNGRGDFKPVSGSPLRVSASAKSYKPRLDFVDVNEDGNVDIVTANGRRNTIEILLGDGRSRFSLPSLVRLEPGSNSYSIALGDIDGDGHLDVVIARSDPSVEPARMAIMRGDGKGGFADVHCSDCPCHRRGVGASRILTAIVVLTSCSDTTPS